MGADGRVCTKKDLRGVLDEQTTIPRDCTELNLYKGNIGPDGATAIAEALIEAEAGNVTIAKVFLGYNSMRDKGAIAIAEALKVTSALTTLNLRDNMIGDIGAAAIADAIEGNAALTTLNLGNNLIQDTGAGALAQALKGNAVVTTLLLELGNRHNIKDRSITDSITTSLAENKDPTRVRVPKLKNEQSHIQEEKKKYYEAETVVEKTVVEETVAEKTLEDWMKMGVPEDMAKLMMEASKKKDNEKQSQETLEKEL